MTHLDIITSAYVMGLFFFGLNGILWLALHNKRREMKIAEEQIIRLLLKSNLRGRR
jgi:hypothetical protein